MKKAGTVLLFLSTLIWGVHANSPVEVMLPVDSVPPAFIESYDTLPGLYAYGIRKFNNFSFIDRTSGKKIQYKPNENLNLGFGFNYRWLGLGVAFNSGKINNDDHIYGNTRSLDLQIDMYPAAWMINTYLQFYKGYYWSNPTEYFPEWNTSDSLQVRSDIRTRTFGTSGVYLFNHERFSYKAPYVFTEIQKKSAGSLLAGASLSIYRIRGEASLIPSVLMHEYPNAGELAGVNTSLLSAMGGYSYTLVFYDNFYANLTLLLGLNYQSAHMRNFDDQKTLANRSLAFDGTARFAIGYNHPWYYLGFTGYLNNFTVRNIQSADLLYGLGKFRFVIGFRLKAPKINQQLDKTIDYLNSKNPIYKE